MKRRDARDDVRQSPRDADVCGGGISLAVFVALHWTIDVKGWRKDAFFFKV